MVFFASVSTQRSGTHLFNSFLDSHPLIKMYGEDSLSEWTYDPDNPEHFYNFWRQKIISDPLAITNRMMLASAEEFFKVMVLKKREMRAVGFDIKYDFLESYPWLESTIRKLAPKIIHLTRRDDLRLYISFFLMRCDDAGVGQGRLQGQLFTPIERLAPKLVRLDASQNLLNVLGAFRARRDKFAAYLKKNYQTLEISYEEIIGGQEGEVSRMSRQAQAKVCRFLGVEAPEAGLGTQMKKANPKDLAQLVENLDQVRSFLKGTPFERHG